MKRSPYHLIVACAATAMGLGASSFTSAGSLYPDPTLAPGATNPGITQANINDTICNPN
jgi:hypothetical protein